MKYEFVDTMGKLSKGKFSSLLQVVITENALSAIKDLVGYSWYENIEDEDGSAQRLINAIDADVASAIDDIMFSYDRDDRHGASIVTYWENGYINELNDGEEEMRPKWFCENEENAEMTEDAYLAFASDHLDQALLISDEDAEDFLTMGSPYHCYICPAICDGDTYAHDVYLLVAELLGLTTHSLTGF